ncbi:GNAT family N-acetyltransferase [Flavilitoribacter nigricans]|uniref:GNAT family N-acetyltransferase n=1 Tax=Flavilitoribacter nigricans (strain ATCC 23147 / DSM 23189 / NBRC 102662 / NCIMB 1420 / SS-2) TaxID=1122177 RepID=A0A2D0NF50_FLAN2|nr:GNAT family N-acetyltransferase [Flavilitoribacter nigricans]PHN07122.1 GNAT family N-acetyltransferase [Flavilitoribacter nigricans DSM 23189 = NBRC 102662]
MKNAQLRPIRPEDNPALARIIREVMTEFNTVGPGYSINDPEVDHMYEAYRDPATSRYYVLEIDGKVVGGGGIGPLANGESAVCELRKMYFLPEARGQGWGRKMVSQCLEAARDLQYRKCYLETVERMETANLLYRKMGFEALCGRLGDTGHCSCDTYFVKEIESEALH